MKIIGKLGFTPYLTKPFTHRGNPPTSKGRFSVTILPSMDTLFMVSEAAHEIAVSQRWRADYRCVVKYYPRIDHWGFTTGSQTPPCMRDHTGRPDRGDMFSVGQTVEVDVNLFPYAYTTAAGLLEYATLPLTVRAEKPNEVHGIAAELISIQLIGGFIRSVE